MYELASGYSMNDNQAQDDQSSDVVSVFHL